MLHQHWLKTALQFRGSVLPAVLPRSLFCGGVALAVSLLHTRYPGIALALKDNLIPSIVLGLLLVFRTNTAYDRFWEGRKCWGTMIVSVRNLARQIWVAIEDRDEGERTEKIAALRLLPAFAIATKHHLRQEPYGQELQPFLTPTQLQTLQTAANAPLEIALWLGAYLQAQHNRGLLSTYQLTAMTRFVDSLVEALSGCERILKTPMPLAYAIHLKQLLLIYCLVLPFQMVRDLQWFTAPAVMLISFTLFGIEEIGLEIENPFGRDANDLPLDAICDTISRNVEDLIQLDPSHPMLRREAIPPTISPSIG